MRKSIRPTAVYSAGLLSLLLSAPFALGAGIDTKKLEALKPRSIGPAAMSGRVTDIAVDPRDSDHIYIGSASGGIWKSTNGGVTWSPIFDDQHSASIGALAIDPLNPDVIWAGSGEGNPRNSQSIGTGIYKSIDAGRSWTRMGLEHTEHIHRVLIHPHRPETVYVAAVGPTWSEGEDRGVFKTEDGGKSWRKVLYVDEKTGCSDLVMDPTNPDKLIAAMWQHRRWPWFFESGGPGSGIHVTHDGGESWKKLTHEDGLPKGDLGRVGLAIAPSRPEVAYALVEAKKNALYRSEDGGLKWRMINDRPNVASRPFYYADIRVDPLNENRIYNLATLVTRSEDGGRSFQTLVPFAKLHPDHHAMWISPENPQHIILGNDGGLGFSRDGGRNWRFVENLPLAQFYHINVDMMHPYNIYGGLQDNGTFRGPAYVWRGGFLGQGILNSYWSMVSFGDGFDVVPDPEQPDRYGYSMSQGGNLVRYDIKTADSKFIRPADPDDHALRFNWNAGLAVDPRDPKTIYYGSQYLHRSRDRGESWERISPDLTSNDPEKQRQLDSGGLTYDVTAAENYTTIVAVAVSPVQEGVIWVGTDDGNVQLTRDGGRNWTNLISNISGVPAGTWVPHIEASKFKEGGAFVVFDDHRRGNFQSYAFRTENFGQTWTNMTSQGVRGNVFVIEQDPVVENLLFLGTEFHLYVSIDGGGSWTLWDQGYPTAPTRDLVVHPREPDLVIGTFGRAIYVMDDITPLRVMAREGSGVMDAPLRVFEIPDAYSVVFGAHPGELIPGDAAFKGENRPFGAMISYVLNPPQEEEAEANGEGAGEDESADSKDKADEEKKVKVEILQGDEVIRTLKRDAEAGLNRFYWGLDRDAVALPTSQGDFNFGDQGGREVLPGTYTVRVSHGQEQSTQSVRVHADPRTSIPIEAMRRRDELRQKWEDHATSLTEAHKRLTRARDAIKRIGEMLSDRDDEDVEALKDQARKSGKRIAELTEQILPKPVQGIRSDPSTIRSQMGRLQGYLSSSWEAPNATERRALRLVEAQVESYLGEIDKFFEEDWKAYEKAVEKAKVSILPKDD